MPNTEKNFWEIVDLKKSFGSGDTRQEGGRKRAIRLPDWNFFRWFRARILLQNIPNYLLLCFGVFFILVMLAMAAGMSNTLAYYQKNAGDQMFSAYQYVLKFYEEEDGNGITTENNDAEIFCLKSLQRKSDAIHEEISVYSIAAGSRYVNIAGLQSLGEGEVYISDSFAEKYAFRLGTPLPWRKNTKTGNNASRSPDSTKNPWASRYFCPWNSSALHFIWQQMRSMDTCQTARFRISMRRISPR